MKLIYKIKHNVENHTVEITATLFSQFSVKFGLLKNILINFVALDFDFSDFLPFLRGYVFQNESSHKNFVKSTGLLKKLQKS